MTCFIHLTDLHLSHPSLGEPQSCQEKLAALQEVADMVRDMTPVPEFVVISGDLTDHGDAESYALLRGAVSQMGVPVILALGNHDKREAFRRVFEPKSDAKAEPFFHHARHGGLHVIVLDSSVPGRVGGAIDSAQFDKLEAALGEHRDAAKLIVCHHPPHFAREGLLAWESLSHADTLKLGEVLEGQNVVGILCGHVHENRVQHWQGRPVIVPVGLHNSLHRLVSGDLVIKEATGVAVCHYEPGALYVTFMPVTPKLRELGRIKHETLRNFS